ncbi:MAG: energy transducer TonB [Bacteroidales bacterium]|nr:energy transducer TonB [Bacteroidales bacterium]MBN2818381.1 energy transducer TonB [Bacteroidales bacterium]
MVQKKSNKSNLENKKTLFFEYGILVALACALAAFEWGQTDINTVDTSGWNKIEDVDNELPPITMPEPPRLAPPPIPVNFIQIKDAEINIDEPDFNFSTEIDIDGEMELYPYEPEDDAVEESIFVIVEKMPTYRNGTEANFQKHVQQLVKYPAIAQQENIQGQVIVQFVVDENGKLVEPKIVRSAHETLSNAVLEALKKTSDWKAGEQRGRKVKVAFTIPIFFKLQ